MVFEHPYINGYPKNFKADVAAKYGRYMFLAEWHAAKVRENVPVEQHEELHARAMEEFRFQGHYPARAPPVDSPSERDAFFVAVESLCNSTAQSYEDHIKINSACMCAVTMLLYQDLCHRRDKQAIILEGERIADALHLEELSKPSQIIPAQQLALDLDPVNTLLLGQTVVFRDQETKSIRTCVVIDSGITRTKGSWFCVSLDGQEETITKDAMAQILRNRTG